MIPENDVIQSLNKFNQEIEQINELLKNKMEERIEWCRKNRDSIKKLYPEKRKIYQISNIREAFYYSSDSLGLTDDIYYFRATDIRFTPHRDFDYHYKNAMPKVKGNVLDCNLKVIRESEIFINQLTEIEQDKSPSKLSLNFTKVYVMIDKNTGYYKIGRSNNPIARERTLQSEKPTIELVHSFDARVKDEKELHLMFENKRIRGEWFDLSGSDVCKINEYFSVTIN